MKHQKHLHLARRKMSRIVDELYTALLHYGSEEVDLRIVKEPEGLRLEARSNFLPEHRHHIERMGELLQPAVRSEAMVEEYWELAGEDQYSTESEIALVGQMADEAEITVDGETVELRIFVEY